LAPTYSFPSTGINPKLAVVLLTFEIGQGGPPGSARRIFPLPSLLARPPFFHFLQASQDIRSGLG
jgi:hypothetical protein